MLWGIGLTAVIVTLFGWLALRPVCEWGHCQPKWMSFLSAPPNEIGDTLAGFAGSLAFIWIIVTVWLQAIELREQRKELRDQRKATQDMAGALQAQAKIFEDEQRQRNENRADGLLNAKLRSFVVSLVETRSQGLNWHFSNGNIDDEHWGHCQINSWHLGSDNYENQPIDEAFHEFRRILVGSHEHLGDLLDESVDYRLPRRSELLSNLIRDLEGIIALRCDLSSSQQERLSMLRLPIVVELLEELDATPKFWSESEQ